MKRFKFWRKLMGGNWYYNRMISDFGRTCIFWWSRKELPRTGGNYCTISEEKY